MRKDILLFFLIIITTILLIGCSSPKQGISEGIDGFKDNNLSGTEKEALNKYNTLSVLNIRYSETRIKLDSENEEESNDNNYETNNYPTAGPIKNKSTSNISNNQFDEDIGINELEDIESELNFSDFEDIDYDLDNLIII